MPIGARWSIPLQCMCINVWSAVVNPKKVLWSLQTAMRLIYSVPKQICTWRWLCFTQYSENLAQHKRAQFWHFYKLKSPHCIFFLSFFLASSVHVWFVCPLWHWLSAYFLFFFISPPMRDTRRALTRKIEVIKASFGYKFKSQILFSKCLWSLLKRYKGSLYNIWFSVACSCYWTVTSNEFMKWAEYRLMV